MDSKLSVQHGHSHHNGISKPPVHSRKGGRQHGHGGAKGIKVVYISSPMKLTASAEEFRAVVQELTGRDSNVADHDLAGGAYSSSSSYSASSYSSFGRVSPTGSAGSAGGASALSSSPTTTMATTASVGTGRAAEYGAAMATAAPPPFQSMYDRTAGSLLYGQDYISW